MNIWDNIYNSIIKNNDKNAMVNEENEFITYDQMHQLILKISSKINSNDRNSRIAIICNSSYFGALAILATFNSGGIAIPISLKYGQDNCKKVLDDSLPAIILADDDEVIKELTQIDDSAIYINVKSVIAENIIIKDYTQKEIEETSTAFIIYTSGTTGKPKGVMLSHSNIMSNIHDIDEYLRLDSDDCVLIIRPLAHASIITRELLYSLVKGATVVFYNEYFSPKRLLRYAEEVKCTYFGATPSILYNLATAKTDLELRNLKKVTVSGECLQEAAIKKIVERFKSVQFFNVYGLTETSPQATYLPFELFNQRICSVGIPLKSVDIKVIDENENEVKSNQIGEILIKGPNVMQGYYNNIDLTIKVIKDGWFYTGDLGYKDDDGFLYIKGRKDHMIIRAGVNIYPYEIESKLLDNKKIKEALVYGIKDPSCGQKICAKVVPTDNSFITQYEVAMICKEILPAYKRPDEIYVVDYLEKNSTGKLIRI